MNSAVFFYNNCITQGIRMRYLKNVLPSVIWFIDNFINNIILGNNLLENKRIENSILSEKYGCVSFPREFSSLYI